MFGYDLLGTDTWRDKCPSYNQDWMATASTPLSSARQGWSDQVLDHPPLEPITGQPYQMGGKGESKT